MEKKKYDPDIHHRRSIRLKDYDYSRSGLYFITICTKDRLNLFGEIVGAGSKPALIDQSICTRAGLEPAPTGNNMNDNNHKYQSALCTNRTRAGLEPAPTGNKMNDNNHTYQSALCTGYMGAGLEPAPTGNKMNDNNHTYQSALCTNRTRAGLEPAPTGNDMILNEYGHIVENTWFDLINHISNIKLYEFVIMPNHIHGIIEIVGAGSKPALVKPDIIKSLSYNDCNGAGLEPAPTKTNMNDRNSTGNKIEKPIPEILRQFKTFSARRINQLRNTPGVPVWQRNYYEHIIRNEEEYHKISEYIINNPIKWQEDKYFA